MEVHLKDTGGVVTKLHACVPDDVCLLVVEAFRI
jgi:hypothetical protein